MGSIDKYIFRTTLASFALVLVSLTGVIWITQALRGIDLMTSQGQTIITFLGLTSLVIPALVLIIAPVALMIAISHTLNKLATDSEIIVMNAAGFSPFRLFRPFFFVTVVVALLVAILGGVAIVSMPVDIFPYIDIPVISVVWQYGGLSPEEMEKRMVTIFERASKAQIEAEVKRFIDTAGKRSRFVLSTSCELPPRADPDCVKWMMDAAREYGRYDRILSS